MSQDDFALAVAAGLEGDGSEPCPCGHRTSDHSTAEQIEAGYPAGCTAIVHDDPNPLYLELCACKRRPWLTLLAETEQPR